ncbi:MAG: hypothetical protein ACD_19C00181G0002 [uncultured bacterium]|nr:MAG: hypothetical protein ACD_19C00181G0002 [uncultured bacterium]
MQKITIRQSKIIAGQGVIAEENIKKGIIIEVVPLLLMSMKEFDLIKQTKLYYYFFEYTNNHFAIALGYGSLYNHSYDPNARYLYNFKKKQLIIKAIKDIKKEEEIFFNYNYYPDDKAPLGDWFPKNHEVI